MGTLKRETESNGHWSLVMLVGLALLAGCAVVSWFFTGQQSNKWPMEEAIRVLEDHSLRESDHRASAAHIHYLAKSGIVALQRASTGTGKPAEDARIYLQKLRKLLEGQ